VESDATGPFNVGVGAEVNVLELVEALRSHTGDRFEPEHAPERPGEVKRIALDCSRAREELGWEARVGLEDGLERTLASLR
jgi:UDP-glucose 4-epimerase